MKTIINVLKEHQIKTFCWIDSQTVLYWISKPSKTLKTFVANRVANIQTESEKYQFNWKFVPGEENPADLISRGCTASELTKNQKWWNGPFWIEKPPLAWPKQPEILSEEIDSESLNETKVVHLVNEVTTLTKNNYPILDAYGEWFRLVQVVTTIFRACHNFRFPKDRLTGNFEPMEYDKAIKFLIQLDQQGVFEKEIQQLKTDNKKIRLGTLVVFWDTTNEVIRIDGRIKSDNLTYDEQNPILLSQDGKLASLLVRNAHQTTGHGGNQLMEQYL